MQVPPPQASVKDATVSAVGPVKVMDGDVEIYVKFEEIQQVTGRTAGLAEFYEEVGFPCSTDAQPSISDGRKLKSPEETLLWKQTDVAVAPVSIALRR